MRLVLMIVLSLGLVGGAAALSLRGSKGARGEVSRRQMLRRLGDSDPDVRREAEQEFRKLNREALPVLREGCGAKDPELARRARRLLDEMEGRTAATTAGPAPETPAETAPSAPLPPVEIMLHIPKTQIGTGETLRFYVRLRNNTAQPVLVARHKVRFMPVYRAFAEFEVSPAEKDPFTVVTELWPGPEPQDDAEIEIVAVAPGATVELYPGAGEITADLHAWMRRPGEYSIRFVYDATGAYAEAAGTATVPGTPLPAARIASNSVTVQVQ